MLPLRPVSQRNFSAGNIETFAMYAGLSILFFFLILFLQQIGGYTPLKSGLATLPVTVVMFVLSRRFGALADRYGPRLFMGAGPLVAAAGLLLFQRAGVKVDYLSEVLPPLLVFALGPVDDGRAAYSRGADGIREAGGYRLGRQQRDRTGGGTAWYGRCGRGDRGILCLQARSQPRGNVVGRVRQEGCQ